MLASYRTPLERVGLGHGKESEQMQSPTDYHLPPRFLQHNRDERFIRKCYHLCKYKAFVKLLFEFITHCQVFDFPKLSMYGFFS